MGFATGFTGGVTLTLSLAYITVLAHQRNRQAQGDALRTQAHVLDTLSSLATTTTTPGKKPPPAPPTREEAAAAARANFADRLKDRWNADVAGAARWAQSQDLGAIREGLEVAASKAWYGALGGAGDAEQQQHQQPPAAAAVEVVLQDGAKSVEEAAAVARRAAKVATDESRAAGAEAAETTKSAVWDLVGKAKAAVGLATTGATSGPETASTAKGVEQLSDVEKALRQRYERTGDVMKKSVTELLDERYTPISQKDNTVLRGI